MVPACSGWSISIEYFSAPPLKLMEAFLFQLFAFSTGHARSGHTALLQDILLCLKLSWLNWLCCTCFALRMLSRLDRGFEPLICSLQQLHDPPQTLQEVPCCASQFNVIEAQNHFFSRIHISSCHNESTGVGLHAESFHPACADSTDSTGSHTYKHTLESRRAASWHSKTLMVVHWTSLKNALI